MAHSQYPLHQFDAFPPQGRLLYLSTFVYEEDWASVVHSHPIAEIFYIINGRGVFMVDGVHRSVKQYDCLIIAPNTPHTEKAFPGQPMEYVVLGVDGLTLSDEHGKYFLDTFEEYNDELLNYLNLMLKESQHEQFGSTAICQHLLSVLLLLVYRKSGLHLVADIQPTSKAQEVPPECGRVKNYIDSYYSDNITLALLARIAGWDRFYLSHAFTKAYGLSPMNYLIKKRLDCAKELLKNSDHTIAEISQMLGFSSQNYFTQTFKRKVGITATEYRKSQACGGE